MQSSVPQPVFLNVEFIFSWLWGNIFGPLFSLKFLALLEFIASILIIIGITVALYSLVRLYEMKQEDKRKEAKERQGIVSSAATASAHSTPGAINLPGAIPAAIGRNDMWENIRAKLLSDSPSDWRLGIIEADIYMDRQFDAKGFPGDTVGDKLKNLSPAQLPSVQIAWEAHKVRNQIAHQGADFSLTMPEARRVLSYYEIVFRDLGIIE